MNSKYLVFVFLLVVGINTAKSNEINKQLNVRTKRNASNSQINNNIPLRPSSGNPDIVISGDENNGEKNSENEIPVVENIKTTSQAQPSTTESPNQESPKKHKIKRKCTIAVIEHRILKLISRKKIPYERIFPDWNLQPTPKKKIKFLNDTLKDLNLRPLPFCRNDLSLDLTPQKVQSFNPKASKQETNPKVPSTTKPPVCNMEEIRSTIQDYITEGSISIWTALRIKNSNLDEKGKLQLINESLVTANLTALQPCTTRSRDKEENKNYERKLIKYCFCKESLFFAYKRRP